MRKKLHQWHAYGALFALIPLVIISITGSILVFKVELDTWLMPEKMQVEKDETSTRLPLDTLMAKVKSQYPDYEIGSWEIFNTSRSDTAYLIKHGTTNWYKLYLNQYTGELLSTPVGTSDDLTDWLLDLHFKLLLETNGMFVGAIISIILQFLGISGIVLYRRFWANFFTLRLKQARRILFSDLHKMVGIVSSPIILVLGFTGAYWNIAEVIHEVSEHVIEEPYLIQKTLYNADISIEQKYQDTAKVIEGFEATYMLMPYEPDINITFFGKINTSNPLNSNYASTVTYDKTTGEMIHKVDIREAGVGHVTVDSFRRLHFGHFAGLPSKIIWCVVGLSPVILAFTGVYLFWYRRRNKLSRSNGRGRAKSNTDSLTATS